MTRIGLISMGKKLIGTQMTRIRQISTDNIEIQFGFSHNTVSFIFASME